MRPMVVIAMLLSVLSVAQAQTDRSTSNYTASKSSPESKPVGWDALCQL